MPADFSGGGWQDLSGDGSAAVRSPCSEDGSGSTMEPMNTDDSLQFFKEETVEGAAVYSVYLKKVRYHTSLDNAVVDVPTSGVVDDRTAHLQWRLEEVRVIRAGTLARLVAAMTSEPSGELDSTYVNTLLATYRTFTTPLSLLTEIVTRYCDVGSNRTLQQQLREGCQRSLKMVMSVWLDTYPEDFYEPPDYPTLSALIQFTVTNAVDVDLSQKVRDQLATFRNREDTEPRGSGLVDELVTCFRLMVLANAQPKPRRRLRPPLDVLTIPAKAFAEQLTYIDAELFKNVVPHHCLSAVWSRRSDKKHPVQPVSVYATVDQFNAVSYRVIATILKAPYQQIGQRAEVIEKWIDIAQECRVLKNFSALKAIIAALQSHSVFRLKKIWQCVTREKMVLFNELAEIFNDSDNQNIWRELLNREGTAKFADPESMNTIRTRGQRPFGTNRGTRRAPNFDLPNTTTMQGTVPYLGTFLTDLTMVDTAFKDVIKDGLVNFDKRRKEFELMTQIHMLQLSAGLYRIDPEPEFFDWFYKIRIYDDSESNELSLIIEPSEPCATIERKTHRKNPSLGFFTPRHRDPVQEGQFVQCDSLTNDNSRKDEDDAHSVSSMHELYTPGPRPQFRHSVSMSSVKSFNAADMKSSLTSPYQTPEMIAVKVYLQIAENDKTNHYKSILLSNNDHARVVLRNTLVKYDMLGKPEDFTLSQLLPDKTELLLPERGNVFYAIRKDVDDIRFVVRRRSETSRSKHKHLHLRGQHTHYQQHHSLSKRQSRSMVQLDF
jgi:ral guanine nucleotide dissociation stimulator-like 1